MATASLPTPAELRQLLRYDAMEGQLYWRERDAGWFADGKRSAEWAAKNWNSRWAGKRAGYIAAHGYCLVQLPSRMECAHRVILAMSNDQWPDHVDHIDGNRANNRLANLRDVSKAENARNIKQSKANRSGVTGVSWFSGERKWVAEIGHNGKKVSLGRFERLADAAEARKQAEIAYGYHANHGRRAA